MDERVVALCNAQYGEFFKDIDFRPTLEVEPTFRSEVALVGQNIQSGPVRRDPDCRVSASRCWRGQIMRGYRPVPVNFFVDHDNRYSSRISITAEIEDTMLTRLITYSQGALSQSKELEEEGHY